MESTHSVLTAYFSRELPNLKETYSWRIPQIHGFDKCGSYGYRENVQLKRFFNDKWKSADTEQKKKIAKQVVSEWGGVRNNKEATFSNYVAEIERLEPKTPLKGVASYSKIFAITDLHKYAIYDARVSVCLNAIQFNSKLENGLAFNYVPGRNNITGNALKKIGFVYDQRFTTKNLLRIGWQKIDKDNTYGTYIEILMECLILFPDYNLYDLEMVLFANAEREARKAMN